MLHESVFKLKQVRYAGLLVCQLFQSFVDARLAKGINFQTFNHFVFAIGACDGETEHDVLGNTVPTL